MTRIKQNWYALGFLFLDAQDLIEEYGFLTRLTHIGVTVAEIQKLHCSRYGYKDNAPFFFDVTFLGWGNAFYESNDKTTGNSSPFALWIVMSATPSLESVIFTS